MGFYSSGILAGSGQWWRGGHGGGTMPEVEGSYQKIIYGGLNVLNSPLSQMHMYHPTRCRYPHPHPHPHPHPPATTAHTHCHSHHHSQPRPPTTKITNKNKPKTNSQTQNQIKSQTQTHTHCHQPQQTHTGKKPTNATKPYRSERNKPKILVQTGLTKSYSHRACITDSCSFKQRGQDDLDKILMLHQICL
ncbi:hypothetical protein RGQ29_027067 [Quercus rubra]|uniref:Uncharacterized protein n=1 Tax=Quercus rubra TaxID=3512 RepID=A0AAN7EN24_QUERU|nr:hypothetical protein RGQ29_027067 [Quercus rubra]